MAVRRALVLICKLPWTQVVGTGGATDADIDMALALVKAAEVH